MTYDQAAQIIDTMPADTTMTQATTTTDTSTESAEQIIAKWRKITTDYEYGTLSMLNHHRRDPNGTSKEAQQWRKARAQVALMQSIMADLATAGIILPEWPERTSCEHAGKDLIR